MAIVSRVDADTKAWCLDASDDKAARAGMVVDLEAAARVVDWVEANCWLYEGERAGELIRLLAYQKRFLTRLFGWRRYNRRLGRWVRRFRRAGLWAAKKNGKSPFLAAMELYTLAADGERGQKVYTAAKDGDQARISQTHAVMMVKSAPGWEQEYKVYENTLEIRHLPTDSVMKILTSGSERNKQSKEGLNGSVFIDECHVVDRTLYKRISRAGISRAEPLDVSVSTAGDDPTSYGKERFDYGRQVAAGDRDDLEFLHVEYCAPDHVSEDEFARDPERFGKLANPAWGEIVDPDEFRGDFDRSRGDPRSFAEFLLYRGNVWGGVADRWLDPLGWAAGEQTYTLDDLAGRECYAALDLSRVRDMTAFVLVFPWEEEGPEAVRVWPVFWMAEDEAKKWDHLFPFRSWAAQGHLRLCPGKVIDYAFVKRDVRAACAGVTVREFYYDPKYAEEITQQLCDGEVHPATGESIAPGIGCERTEFPQTLPWFTAATDEFERRVVEQAVFHPGNRVLTWQVGHAVLKENADGRCKPVKPEEKGPRTVDGVVCCVMALFGAMNRKPQGGLLYV